MLRSGVAVTASTQNACSGGRRKPDVRQQRAQGAQCRRTGTDMQRTARSDLESLEKEEREIARSAGRGRAQQAPRQRCPNRLALAQLTQGSDRRWQAEHSERGTRQLEQQVVWGLTLQGRGYGPWNMWSLPIRMYWRGTWASSVRGRSTRCSSPLIASWFWCKAHRARAKRSWPKR